MGVTRMTVDARHVDRAFTGLAQGYHTDFLVYRARVQGEDGEWVILGSARGGILAQRFVSDESKGDDPVGVLRAAVLDMVEEVVEGWTRL
jgi:hypothetical protein